MKLRLRPYQQDAVSAVIEHFRENDQSACLVLPTGAGKSLVIAELARLAKGRLLILAHVKELCTQNHDKFVRMGGEAGLFAAGLGKKQAVHAITFATVQSVARNRKAFEGHFSLLIVDECHRLSGEEDSQYAQIVQHLRQANPTLKILGLTATPYRLGMGWIYRYHHRGVVRSAEPRPFEICVYELSLRQMLQGGYLTPPHLIDAPVAQYDFSTLDGDEHGNFPTRPVNELLVRHARVTESIIEQVRELSIGRKGVMIFAATVEHAREIAAYLPGGEVALILGETASSERDAALEAFQRRELKYLVNVAVLTTGFDAPHVDLIALLRPTQSVSLFQQIAGRGLRLCPGKTDCLIIDYAGNGLDLFTPEVGEKKPHQDSQPVSVACPECGFENTFWGLVDETGRATEHYGRRCAALRIDAHGRRAQCEFRYRFKECTRCGAQNDIAARQCERCQQQLTDPDEQLRAALKLKGAQVLRVAGMTFACRGSALIITYHDEDGAQLNERFDFASDGQRGVFYRVFGSRTTSGAAPSRVATAQAAAAQALMFKAPDFVVARKSKRFWDVTERIFDYEGRYRRANER
jgi:DNA repair protein RadD